MTILRLICIRIAFWRGNVCFIYKNTWATKLYYCSLAKCNLDSLNLKLKFFFMELFKMQKFFTKHRCLNKQASFLQKSVQHSYKSWNRSTSIKVNKNSKLLLNTTVQLTSDRRNINLWWSCVVTVICCEKKHLIHCFKTLTLFWNDRQTWFEGWL